jgi:uncharacterized protein
MRTMQASTLRKVFFTKLDEIASGGESVEVIRFKRPVAMLVPVTDRARKPLLDLDAIAAFCRCHAVKSFALFGSIMRDDFNESSDVDVLLSLGSVHEHSFITMTGMRNELSKMFGRDVDIVIRESLPRANPLRRQAIESEAKVIYEIA